MTALDYLRLGAEAYLSELSDDEFDALIAVTRAPKDRKTQRANADSVVTTIGGR